jgi:hypothetical protein
MPNIINKVIKTSYHFFATIFLLYLAKNLQNYHIFFNITLIFLSIFHLYDTWWFLNYDKDAPI